MSNLLITSTTQKVDKTNNDENIYYLGEWCSPNRCEGNIFPPILAEVSKQKEIYPYLNEVRGRILITLSQVLNQIHDTNFSKKSWNIILGHWLRRYVELSYNRYVSIKKVQESSKSYILRTKKANEFSMVPRDSLQFIFNSNDSFWNETFYNEVVIFLELENVEVQWEEGICVIEEKKLDYNKRSGFKSFLYTFFSYVLQLFQKKTDYFIFNSYLSRKDEFKLHLKLGQCPQLPVSQTVHYPEISLKMREKLVFNISEFDEFENFLKTNIKKFLPKCYLEGFSTLVKQARSCGWPDRPKAIFTSNNFDTDELFKVYTAIKIEEGSRYIAGQHGNNYGTHWYAGNKFWPERESSDYFLSWGFEKKNSNVIPGFLLKTQLKSENNHDPSGDLLLICVTLPHRLSFYDIYTHQKRYQDDLFDFYGAVSEIVKGSTLVRLHPGFKLVDWGDDVRWKCRYPDVRLERGVTSISSLIQKSRLVVHSYDSTGLLETLAMNIPCIAFWQNGLDHLNESAKADYEDLAKNNLIFFSPDKAATHINKIWDDVSAWWNSVKVRQAREKFCEKYARTSQNPSDDLAEVISHFEDEKVISMGKS